MYDSPPILQRHMKEREDLSRDVLGLPIGTRRDLVKQLLWSLPRNEIIDLTEELRGMLQRDIIGSLPPELSFSILSKLELVDLLNCQLVCKKWREICEEQTLWAILCTNHIPPIKPAQPTWSEISACRSSLSRRKLPISSSSSPDEDEDEAQDEMGEYGYGYDDRFGYANGIIDPPISMKSIGIGHNRSIREGIDPLGMKGGLRRNVWERGNSQLPLHLQSPTSTSSRSSKTNDGIAIGIGEKWKEPLVSSHLSIPSTKPQVNYKHLYITNQILNKRFTTPRSTINTSSSYALTENHHNGKNVETKGKGSKQLPRIPKIPKAKTIDAISSVKSGGLPGHSEAIYSLTLIHHQMKINLSGNNQSCPDCHPPFSSTSSPSSSATPSSTTATAAATATSAQLVDPFGISSQSSTHHDTVSGIGALMPGQKKLNSSVISGREWLLSGSRDKTLRLWQLSITEPRVVKVFSGGHTGSVLTHSVVKIPVSINITTNSNSSSPTEGVEGMNLNGNETDDGNRSKRRERVVAVSGGSDGKICLWDIQGFSSNPEKTFQAHEDSVLCVRADDQYVVSCSKDKTIRLFDINTLEEKLVIGPSMNGSIEDERLHRGAVNAVGLSKDYIISASGDKTLRIWSIHTGQLLHVIEAHSRGIASIDFQTSLHPPSNLLDLHLETGDEWRGSIVTGASDASIKLFHLIERDVSFLRSNQQRQTATKELSENALAVGEGQMMDLGSTFTSDVADELSVENGKFVYLKEDKTMWAQCICPPGLHRPSSETNGLTICKRCGNRGHSDLIRTVYMGENIVVSGSYDSRVKIWDRSSGQHLIDLSGAHTGRVFSVVGDKLKIISSGLDCRINIWDFSHGLDTSFVEL
ncbi:uncharacterized protein IL334_000184 [Kwoniella shivajii]|uniref:F-box domain-containing protein n=1 Tax=Kwoniella shivajii TaxID=564305 RepID=A0ABZ1CNF5_9TREE|nr:hypothetical protein IL334_000184 [Kwoniella shivajii]